MAYDKLRGADGCYAPNSYLECSVSIGIRPSSKVWSRLVVVKLASISTARRENISNDPFTALGRCRRVGAERTGVVCDSCLKLC